MTLPSYSNRNAIYALLLIMLLAGLLRLWLIENDSIRFSSDEAVVGLMAHHILEGKPIPTFYYGQHYFGSLDSLVVAGSFLIFGESVESLRLAQLPLYLLVILTAYLATNEISGRPKIALVVALLMAIPTMIGGVFTSMAFGGHNENIIFSNLIYLLGWRVTVKKSESPLHWGLLGLVMGVGWWNYGAIATPIAVVGLMGLYYFSFSRWRLYGLATILFVVGSTPWWLYNLHHDWLALRILTGGEPLPIGFEPISLPERIVAFVFLGLPSLYGLRMPWELEFRLSVMIAIVIVIYWLLITDALTSAFSYWHSSSRQYERRFKPIYWVWLCIGVTMLAYMVSPFRDISGRYFLPIWTPLCMGLALGITRLKKWWRMLPAVALVLILAYQGITFVKSVYSDIGIEYIEIERYRVPKGQDEAVLAFLENQDYTRGYASYWASLRLTFLSGEDVIFDTSLPHDDRGYTTGQNRYKPYIDEVAEADRVVWLTQDNPKLDQTINALLDEAHITYQVQDFGTYRVYYDFSERVAPSRFGLNVPETAHQQMVKYGGAIE